MEYNPEEYSEILQIFKAESEEIIQELNSNFLELEKNPENKAPVKRLMQLAHSLKGASRMLGFNGIQDISHKLEDVLSYWKNDTVIIKNDSFQIFYDICDYLLELIHAASSEENNDNNDKVFEYLNKLENFIVRDKLTTSQDVQVNIDKYIHTKNIDINAIVLELMFIIEKDNEDEDTGDIMPVIAQNLKELSEIFAQTDYNLIKQKISFLFDKVSVNVAEFDLNLFKQKIPELRTDIYNLYKKLNINSNINKHIRVNKEEVVSNSDIKDDNSKLKEDFDYIFSNLQKIKFEKDFLIKVSEMLKLGVNKSDKQDINNVLNKMVNLLDIFIKRDVIIDNDCYMVILHGLYLAKNVLLSERIENNSNVNFLLQRLNVIEDMYNISETPVQNEVLTQKSSNVLNPQEFINLQKNMQAFDIQEIRTLRIDSSKLDNLISQTGELLVNGIKAREHIIDLAKVNEKIIKWHSDSKKVMTYLRYMEKKGYFNKEAEDSNNFYKKAQNFFSANADLIDDINSDFSNIYNMISEDNNKLHQTALEIETIAKGIRVLPLATIFHSFPRMVRDIAKENGKQINFVISGSDTIVDKKIIEEIKMPLIHILRNSIYHGIEKPEDRIKNNKDETGTIKLIAKQVENNIIITIEDDGYGINFAKVKETALVKGLLTPEEINNMPDEQVMKLLFLPGFSTEETVNEISGRGIGLDVVKTKITNLNGDITIESVLNKGCRITIKLPLSMSTIKTFIILVNKQKYAIPITSIKKVKQMKKEDVFKKDGMDCVIFDNHTIPVYSISNIFGEKATEVKNPLTLIIIENQEKQAAFLADKLIGDQEVFLKKLVPPILKIKNINGFTTLSTGEICLIINPYELIKNTVGANN